MYDMILYTTGIKQSCYQKVAVSEIKLCSDKVYFGAFERLDVFFKICIQRWK